MADYHKTAGEGTPHNCWHIENGGRIEAGTKMLNNFIPPSASVALN